MGLLKNGIQIPAKILNNHWDEFINKIVYIKQYEFEGVEIPYENGMGRLLEFKSDGRCRFQRGNGSKFEVHLDDIKNLELYQPRNYNEN